MTPVFYNLAYCREARLKNEKDRYLLKLMEKELPIAWAKAVVAILNEKYGKPTSTVNR